MAGKPEIPGGFLDLVALFCNLVDELFPLNGRGASSTSLRDFARRQHMTPANVSQRIRRLEKLLGRKNEPRDLFVRQKGSGLGGLTRAGKGFYREARSLLAIAEGMMPGSPKLQPEQSAVRVSVASTLFLLHHFFPWVMNGPHMRADDARLVEFREAEYAELLSVVEKGVVDFAFGPALSVKEKQEHPRLVFVDLPPRFDMAAVFNQQHAFAREHVQQLRLAELCDQHLVVVPDKVQPGLSRPFPETDWSHGGRRTVLPHYDAILAFVQAGAQNTVGIVPCWPPALDELVRSGKIGYAPLPELGQIRMSLYLPDQSQSSAAQNLIAAIEKESLSMDIEVGALETERMPGMPRDLLAFKYGYHVSRDSEGRSEWRRSKIQITASSSGELSGALREMDGKGAPCDYVIHGQRHQTMLSYAALANVGSSRQNDVFSETFHVSLLLPRGSMSSGVRNVRATQGAAQVLLGNWSGVDDNGEPVTAAAVLATETIGFKEVNHLLLKFGGTWFLNAHRAFVSETGLPVWRKENAAARDG
jgi:DNA-binding transcriptional LysR family regulator